MKKLTTILAVLLFCSVSSADSVQTPYPKATTSKMGLSVFVMVPVLEGDEVKLGQGKGIMYTVRLDGSLEKKWNVEGWYSFGTYPSDDGVYLTRFGDWPTGDSPKKEDLAVAFYKQGKLIRTYSTADLIVDPKKVRVTVSHYQWLAEGQHGHFYYKQFGLTTIEGREIIFDLESGEITKVYEPNPENCSHAKP